MKPTAITHKHIDDYLEWVEHNPLRINEDRRLLIENIVRPTLLRSDVFFDVATYEKCISYCENNYYKLFPYQKFIYAFVFMYVDDAPLFRQFLILMGRGNGKDGMFMPLMNFLQTPLYGVENYNIDIIANNEEQAKDTFNVVYDMLNSNKSLKSKFYVSLESIKNLATLSRLRYNTSNAKTKDGKKTGALLFNEYHAYETNDQIKVFKSGLGKIRHPRTFIITTNGNVRGGPLDEMLDVCNDVLKSGDNPLSIFPFLCRLDNADEVDNPECWHKANPSLQFMPILHDEIRNAYVEMKRMPSMRVEFMTKRMNMPEENNEISVATWEQILMACYDDAETKTERQTPDLSGQMCVVGIDYASISDFASVGFLFNINGEYVWRQKTFICSSGPWLDAIKFPIADAGLSGFEDFEVVQCASLSPEELIDWALNEAAQNGYSIQKFVMDNYRFGLMRTAFEARGLDIETNKNPMGMVRMIRHSTSINNLVSPIIEKAFADGNINFGDSAIMRWYTRNTMTVIDKYGNKNYGKIEPKLRKNDGFMAMVVAMSAASLLEQVVYYI